MGCSPWGPKEFDMTELQSMHTLPHYREQNVQVTPPPFSFLLSLLINLISRHSTFLFPLLFFSSVSLLSLSLIYELEGKRPQLLQQMIKIC